MNLPQETLGFRRASFSLASRYSYRHSLYFQNPLTGLNFQGTGTLASPLGAKLLRTSAMPEGKLIGLDKNYALERINGSDVLVEYDKLIDRQIERAAITSISGFAKPYQDASKVLSI